MAGVGLIPMSLHMVSMTRLLIVYWIQLTIRIRNLFFFSDIYSNLLDYVYYFYNDNFCYNFNIVSVFCWLRKKICQAVSPCLRMTDKISDLKEKKNSKDFTSRSKSIAQYNQRLWNVMSINNLKCQVYKYFFPDK